jgi:NAD(P)-dependent dehydrogenase (short-subunit alcohol dehydrogenase family)
MTPAVHTHRLAGLHAVVTGASRGIGAVIAASLAAEGVQVS